MEPEADYDPDDYPELERLAEPRKASRSEVNRRLDRLALVISAAHEELSELRHELGIAERAEIPAPRRNYEVD